MLNGQVDVLRAQIIRIFRHGTEQERSLALHTVEDDVAALTQKKASESDITGQWRGLLLSYLASHPEAYEDIKAFASGSVVNKVTSIGSQHNHGSGPFIGGDNYGDMTFRS